ncbi:MAG: DUF6146 family protein [Psychroflexus sp.]|nr:DUF6146 family protein [Psychroflexus sp.]
MKSLVFILIFISVISCRTTQTDNNHSESRKEVSGDTIKISNDSLDYQVIVFEPGFGSWLQTQKPRGFYSQKYLERHNQNSVIIYNGRVYSKPRLYPQEIDYQVNIDYGYEVNYMLFHYFLFFEQKYNQKLR